MADETSFRQECLSVMLRLCEALAGLQVHGPAHAGAIRDPACGVLHSRGAEAVLPFAVAFKATGEQRWLSCALAAGDWLVGQQEADGSWRETPGIWQGTTTDQLLALCCALQAIEQAGSPVRDRRKRWGEAITRAADFIAGWVSEGTAHINYCATASAALAAAFQVTGDERHAARARQLARDIVTRKIDSAGFLFGEGHRFEGAVFGVDPGYNIDMSLWSLAFAARLLEDEEVENAAAASLRAHLPLVYPDGSLDNSWGVRSNKWTVYGSKTAHGCQAGFALLASHDPAFRTAGRRNLRFLEGMMCEGLVGYGPQWWERAESACIYPTFTRAANLALAVEYGQEGAEGPIPADAPFTAHLDTVGCAVIRTSGLMATVAASTYKDPAGGPKSKYMARPSGGGVTHLWFDGYGLLQVASQTRYRRWEPIHFPEAADLLPLSPRIEQTAGGRLFSSLNEFDASLTVEPGPPPRTAACGVLRDERGRPGRCRYEWRHEFTGNGVTKEARLKTKWRPGIVRIVEPVIEWAGTAVQRKDERTVEIRSPRGAFLLRVEEGSVALSTGGPAGRYWWPMPALQGHPITLSLEAGAFGGEQVIRYRFERVA